MLLKRERERERERSFDPVSHQTRCRTSQIYSMLHTSNFINYCNYIPGPFECIRRADAVNKNVAWLTQRNTEMRKRSPEICANMCDKCDACATRT